MFKVWPKKYQVSVVQANNIDDSVFQEEQHVQFQVSYEDNIESSLCDPSGQLLECDNEPEPSATILKEDDDVALILFGDEENEDVEYICDECEEDINYYYH